MSHLAGPYQMVYCFCPASPFQLIQQLHWPVHMGCYDDLFGWLICDSTMPCPAGQFMIAIQPTSWCIYNGTMLSTVTLSHRPLHLKRYIGWYIYPFQNYWPSNWNRNNFPDRPVHLEPRTGRHRVARVRRVIVNSAGRCTTG